MPRLLHIMDYEAAGTRTFGDFIYELAVALRDAGWEVCYALRSPPEGPIRAALREAGVRTVVVPFPFTWRSMRCVRAQLGGYRPDVTQTSFVSAFTWPLLALKLLGFTRRLVVIDHSSGLARPKRGWRRLAAWLRGRLVGKVVDAVVPVSHAIAERDVRGVFLPADKVHVIYNGVRLGRFRAEPRGERDTLRIVYAGQLIPEKGVDTLVRAYGIVRAGGSRNHELVIAGRGQAEADLKALCRAEGVDGVRFVGHIDSTPDLFAAADIVVVPSAWHEAFGLVAAEAMAVGAACLVSDAGALAEVVGDCGRVFKARDAADLARELRRLIDGPADRAALGAAARRRVEENFTLSRKVRAQVDLCNCLIGRGGEVPNQ